MKHWHIHHIIIKILITAVAVLVGSFILDKVYIHSSWTAIVVALVLGILNTVVRPLLIVLTIPLTIFTLGLFLLVINMLIIKLTSELVPGFRVDGWWTALWFSIIVSISSSLIESFFGINDKKRRLKNQ